MKRKGNELVNGSLVFIDNNLLLGSILTGPLPICRGFLEHSFNNQSSTVRDKIQDSLQSAILSTGDAEPAAEGTESVRPTGLNGPGILESNFDSSTIFTENLRFCLQNILILYLYQLITFLATN